MMEILKTEQWSSATFTGWRIVARGVTVDIEDPPPLPGLIFADVMALADGSTELLLVEDGKAQSCAAVCNALRRAIQ